MEARSERVAIRKAGHTHLERQSDLELVITRTFHAAPRIVFGAWTTPDLFMRWWAPRSTGMSIVACEMDARTGGSYRLRFGDSASESWSFFGTFVEVTPFSRIVWTNDEEPDGAVTTVTFEERDGSTLLTFHERYPSKEALDQAIASGNTSTFGEQFEQLDELLLTIGTGEVQGS